MAHRQDPAPRERWLTRSARRTVVGHLSRITRGHLQLREGERCDSFGIAAPDEPLARIEVVDPSFYRSVVFGGGLGAAESYLQGHWTADDLVPLFRLLARNQAAMERVGRGPGWLQRPLTWARRWACRNTRAGSRKNIRAHYDLGNDFFRLFLDETLTYSSGIFPHSESTLAEASREKYDRICRQLQLRSDHRVIEIGTGWGGFAIHAAAKYGCHVTTTTISQQQYDEARQRVEAAGLGERVTLLQRDYRELTGVYDRLVSIEMIEAVGHEFLPAYFQKCASLLNSGGQMMIQAITIPDQRYDEYRRSVDFIQRYIFPGGCLPSLGAIVQAVATTPDLQWIQLEEFAEHYARTLARWRAAFRDRLAEVRQLGLDERFIRMWDYYLAYCEAGFRERMTGVCQLRFLRAT